MKASFLAQYLELVAAIDPVEVENVAMAVAHNKTKPISRIGKAAVKHEEGYLLGGVGPYGVDAIGSRRRWREVAVAVAKLVQLEVVAAQVQARGFPNLHPIDHYTRHQSSSRSSSGGRWKIQGPDVRREKVTCSLALAAVVRPNSHSTLRKSIDLWLATT
jgi:hypothetical protein